MTGRVSVVGEELVVTTESGLPDLGPVGPGHPLQASRRASPRGATGGVARKILQLRYGLLKRFRVGI